MSDVEEYLCNMYIDNYYANKKWKYSSCQKYWAKKILTECLYYDELEEYLEKNIVFIEKDIYSIKSESKRWLFIVGLEVYTDVLDNYYLGRFKNGVN